MNNPRKGFDDDGNRYPEPTLPPTHDSYRESIHSKDGDCRRTIDV